MDNVIHLSNNWGQENNRHWAVIRGVAHYMSRLPEEMWKFNKTKK